MTGKPNLTSAEYMSQVAHAGQLYHNPQTGVAMPYSAHCGMVVGVLKRFGMNDDEMLCAAHLHDTIEDTTMSYNDIRKEHGEGVAELVFAVSSELGRNRKERNAKTYPKIRASERATILKLADRIANVEFGTANGGKVQMYAEEFPEFFKGIWVEPKTETSDSQVLTRMWAHLRLLLKA